MGKGLLLWLIGIPIPIILLIWLLADFTSLIPLSNNQPRAAKL